MDRKILVILLVVIIAALLFVAVEYQKESSTVKLS